MAILSAGVVFLGSFRVQRWAAAKASGFHRVLACLGITLCGSLALLVSPSVAWPQSGGNSDPNYLALRSLSLGSEAVSIANFDLKRDAGTFRLNSGKICFAPAVNGKVTAAVFEGDGIFLLTPPTETERKSLKYLTKEDEFNEKFEKLVLRFTDGTYEELKKAGTAAAGSCDPGPLKDSQNTTRHRINKIKRNLEADLLGEVLSPEPRGIFLAFVHGKRYDDKEIYELDPNQDSNQVDFLTYDESKWGDWASFNFSKSVPAGSVGRPMRIEHHQLETTLERSGALSGKSTTTFVSLRNGLRVVPFSLFPTLRVQSVTADGQPLSFIQEDKHEDADFAVILPKPLAAGDKFTVTTTYSGKEAVSNEGGGNYFPIARDNWYPNSEAYGEYASYDMSFRIPKGMKIAATGALVSEATEGGQNVTVWKSEAPQTVAGFNFGKFKVEEAKLTKPEVLIRSFANEESPNWVQSLQQAASGTLPTEGSHIGAEVALGTMSTTSLNKKALAEGELAVQLYTDYFGPSLFTYIQITQQTACNFGQAWPGLVWVPICYYFDTTVRHQLGMDWGDRGYWKVVTPHEVAHQWWGHTVGFSSTRDQWMSEGFADMSASLYLSMIEKDPKKFLTFWNDERQLLLERDAQGYRAIDAAPLIMGYRANNSRTGGGVTRRLIYPKGAYVLHMIRMMMYDRTNGDKLFKETMQDFVNTYRGKAATTEDFKSIVEKHMTRGMDIEGKHQMDWFFNQYVYGTGIAQYSFHASLEPTSDGKTHMKAELTRTGVADSWKDLVAVYAHLGDKTFRLGSITSSHPTESLDVTLGGKIDRVTINDFDDLLAEVKQ